MRTLKIKDRCEIIKEVKKGRVYFGCKNLKREPSLNEIINSIKPYKIKYK